MSKIFNISGHKRAPDTSAPASKRYCAELANPSETFQSIRSEGYRTATYDVDTTVRQEEEHPRDPETLLAPVFVHSQQFSTPQPAPGTKPPGQINQRVLWRVGTNGLASQKHAAIKLTTELGRSPDWDAPLEKSISFSVEPLVQWHRSVGTVKAVDHSVRLHVCAQRANQILRDTVVWDVFQPYNTAQQYAAAVCECLGLRFDWYKAIVAAVDSLLRDIWEECKAEGFISLQRITSQDVGIREPPAAAESFQAPQTQPGDPSAPPEDCTMTDDDTAASVCVKGSITVKIELDDATEYAKMHLTTVDHCSCAACSKVTQTAETSGPSTAVQPPISYVPGQPLLTYTAVSKAQETWAASREYRVPTLLQYSAHHDTRITWQQRMSAIRTIWAAKDAAEKTKSEKAAAKKASEIQKQAQAAQAAQEKARLVARNQQQSVATQSAATQQHPPSQALQQQQQAQLAPAVQQHGPQPVAAVQVAQPSSGPPNPAPSTAAPVVVQQAQQHNPAQGQPAQTTRAAAAAQEQPVAVALTSAGGAGNVSRAAPAATALQPQHPSAGPAAAVQQGTAAAHAAHPAAATPAHAGVAQVSTQAPAATAATKPAGAAPAAAVQQAAAGPSNAAQWQNMFQNRIHNRTRSLVQVANSDAAPAPAAATTLAPTAVAAPATIIAPTVVTAAVAAADKIKAEADPNADTLQESMTYVTQASQDQLFTAFHEMQRHLQQASGSEDLPTGAQPPKTEEGPQVKHEPT